MTKIRKGFGDSIVDGLTDFGDAVVDSLPGIRLSETESDYIDALLDEPARIAVSKFLLMNAEEGDLINTPQMMSYAANRNVKEYPQQRWSEVLNTLVKHRFFEKFNLSDIIEFWCSGSCGQRVGRRDVLWANYKPFCRDCGGNDEFVGTVPDVPGVFFSLTKRGLKAKMRLTQGLTEKNGGGI
jgi:hypothetical protein